MVKKVFLIFVMLAVMGGSLFSADLRYINLNAIKDMNAFSDELNYALLNQNAMRWWVSDDAWNNPTPKSEVAAVLRDLYVKLCEHDDPDNQEYLLLKAAISDFLYNFDEPGFFEVTKANYLAIEELPERDYRYKWFLGTFWGTPVEPWKLLTASATSLIRFLKMLSFLIFSGITAMFYIRR